MTAAFLCIFEAIYYPQKSSGHISDKLSFVVGYQTKTTVAGFNFIAPTFTNLSGGDVDVQAIVLAGDKVTALADTIQILDDGGAVQEVYMWDDGSIVTTGWITESFELAEKTIKPGQSVLIATENDGVVVTMSGEVASTALVTTSVAGFNFVGNATPVAVDIQDVTLSGKNVTALADTIQFLDEGGAPTDVYMWDDGSIVAEGWIDETFTLVEKNIAAGEGVLIATENAGVVITVPSAL